MHIYIRFSNYDRKYVLALSDTEERKPFFSIRLTEEELTQLQENVNRAVDRIPRPQKSSTNV